MACPWSCWKRGRPRLRWKFSATRPTKMMREDWRTWRVRVGIDPSMSRVRRVPKYGFCWGHRRTLKRKLLNIENEIRQSLKVFGSMVGPRVQRATFVARVHELVACDRLITGVTDCMLRAWEALWAEYKRLHDLLVQMVGRDELCRRFCAIPGVGPVTALTFKAAIDDPHRFSKSKTVGAHFD
ncbi:putative transposase (fragment) [Bradyrhizobium sp. ORS 285]